MHWMLIALLLTVGLFLIVNNINIKASYKVYIERLKRRGEGLNWNLGYSLSASKAFYSIDKRIEKSNIRFFIPYNTWIHLSLCLLFFLMAGTWMNQYMSLYISIIFGGVAAIVPFIFLQLFSDMMGYRVKRMSVDFLIILRRFLIGGKGSDIFEAFSKASKYVLQPLKSYVELFVFEYKHKLNPIQCFENLKDRIESSELRIYIENLLICYVRGGDLVEITDTFIEEIERQNDDEDEENAKDMLLSLGLYILLAVNFLILYMLFNSSYKGAVFDSQWGQIVFILDMLVSFYIAYLTLEKVD